jgi:hypothetical protein
VDDAAAAAATAAAVRLLARRSEIRYPTIITATTRIVSVVPHT